ncbi:hypothetical protein U0358_06480 [Idiomarina sp. PL1-037]|uniref:hypothetical protein n=1 Tax=Idiomarina sp. PL1-037 TaxID=3095365 RepID=UPI002ACC0BC7|nr:hypothetical protein [Idiomarina sp. PL1-037]WQC54196.1 hypothetical protein U0358_06480 [Idiomarina sp. PL1-037]
MRDEQVRKLYRVILTQPLKPQNKAAKDLLDRFMATYGERVRLLNLGRSGQARELWLEIRTLAEQIQHLMNSGDVLILEGAQ